MLAPAGLRIGAARDAARMGIKILVDSLFLVYLAWEFRRVWLAAGSGHPQAVQALIEATARASLVIILVVSIWVQAWYFILPLGLAVLLGWRSRLARVAVGYTLMALPALYFHYYLQDTAPGAIYLVYAGVPLLPALSDWLRPRLPARSTAVEAVDSVRRGYEPGLRGRLGDERGQTRIADAAARSSVAKLDARMANHRESHTEGRRS